MISQLRAAVGWEAYGESLEAQISLGDIPPEDLDKAVAVLEVVLGKAKALRKARAARTVDGDQVSAVVKVER